MDVQGTDFELASAELASSPAEPTTSKKHILPLDFHTQPSTPLQPRPALRDAALRLLHKLFNVPPPATARPHLTALVASPLPDPSAAPTLSLLTETSTLSSAHHHHTTRQRMRAAARPPASPPPPAERAHARTTAARLRVYTRGVQSRVVFLESATCVRMTGR